jgi:GxxExxY protein
MPILAPTLPRLSEDEMRELDREVMRHVFAAHNDLGSLCDERIYQADLAARLAASGISARREVSVRVSFLEFSTTRDLDLVVADRAIYELKSVSALSSLHEAQVLTYLLLANATRAKLVNFRPASVESRFVNTTLDHAARHDFTVDATAWHGPIALREWVAALLSDWGTGLEQPLYHAALVHFLGGESVVTHPVPLHRGALELGTQCFDLISPESAISLTCLEPPRDPGLHASPPTPALDDRPPLAPLDQPRPPRRASGNSLKSPIPSALNSPLRSRREKSSCPQSSCLHSDHASTPRPHCPTPISDHPAPFNRS